MQDNLSPSAKPYPHVSESTLLINPALFAVPLSPVHRAVPSSEFRSHKTYLLPAGNSDTLSEMHQTGSFYPSSADKLPVGIPPSTDNYTDGASRYYDRYHCTLSLNFGHTVPDRHISDNASGCHILFCPHFFEGTMRQAHPFPGVPALRCDRPDGCNIFCSLPYRKSDRLRPKGFHPSDTAVLPQ